MKVGVATFMNNATDSAPDHEVYRQGLAIAEQAEDLGFDSLWAVEHHFSGYAMIPDVLQFLTYLAGRTKKVQLGAGVVVLPWNNPFRVAEQVAALDLLSGGRLILGLGRGSASSEYAGFNIPMEESRERFREGVEILVAALSGGPVNYQGKFHKVNGLELRPRPRTDMRSRLYGASISPESAELMARLGLGVLVAFPAKGWANQGEEVRKHRKLVEAGGRPVLPTIGQVYCYCGEDKKAARKAVLKYMGTVWAATEAHYRYETVKNVRGYEHYAKVASTTRLLPQPFKTRYFASLQVHGTPERCLEKIRMIRERCGVDHLIVSFIYGDMPLEEADRSMKLFAREVLPHLHK